MQQLVAVARALDVPARVLILDEPTSSLDEKEVAELFAIVRQLRAQGMAIVFVTHFLDQVYAVCDRITVLRNGRRVGEFAAAELPRIQLVSHMLGRPAEALQAAAAAPAARGGGRGRTRAGGEKTSGAATWCGPWTSTCRRARCWAWRASSARGAPNSRAFSSASTAADSGEVRVAGQPRRHRLARRLAPPGLRFHAPRDRKAQAILPNLSVRENLIVALQVRRGLWRRVPRSEQDPP